MIVVQTTTATLEQSETIAEALLADRLTACVQITPVRSRYVWKGEVQREDEHLLLIKTQSARFEAVRARIRGLHPYETPEIIALSVSEGDPDYLAWVAESTS
ncbi:divalent-cation tolerance protein CutA [Phenylobacterium deserti]|uniref:Divalent-cation tolerance protein CutA n=1 Tax=Phenylobacterium deserti TaxID=1914756 RepID=A0A328A9X3_9CAUL|nr:divalent-cation tolerance protein CutA [Phenylobacterium deserti]RAK51513.1 divalent-cation tolerance protein CutA [Phenylobacterium deserti]